jgi:hypothetical protein
VAHANQFRTNDPVENDVERGVEFGGLRLRRLVGDEMNDARTSLEFFMSTMRYWVTRGSRFCAG